MKKLVKIEKIQRTLTNVRNFSDDDILDELKLKSTLGLIGKKSVEDYFKIKKFSDKNISQKEFQESEFVNSKEYKKKFEELDVLTNFLWDLNLENSEYIFNNLSDKDIFDFIISNESNKIGIELTQLNLNQEYIEFDNVCKKIFIELEKEYNHLKIFIRVSLNEFYFKESKRDFRENLYKELHYILNNFKSNFKDLEFKAIKKFDITEESKIHIYSDKYVYVKNVISNNDLNSIIQCKNDKKFKNTEVFGVESYEKWLIIFSYGRNGDNYVTIDLDSLNKVSNSYFDFIFIYNQMKRKIIKLHYI